MKKIAVYGKGGIGKSTMSANLSVALARRGRKVLQVGCDPKHDSTRLLLHGVQPTTALDYLRVTKPTDYDLSAVLQEGYEGVGCVEAGGPKPGVGCAGRGIISTFELLEQFKLDECYDTVLYDVLGDVVCGGFAVPIRREYADTILVVTSGEFMSLYAANNILRGIANYDGDTLRRIAGLVYNSRDVAGEDERVERFAQAVGLPICAYVPRSDSFAQAERANMTVMEKAEDERLCRLFDGLAEHVLAGGELHEARPLTDEDLERVVLGSEPAARAALHPSAEGADALPGRVAVREGIDLADPNRYLSKTLVNGEPLHGCAFNGAIATALHVTDAVVIAHAPTSCTNMSLQSFTAAGRRSLYERGSLLPASLAPHLQSTDMGQPEIVFGGTDLLLAKVAEAQRAGARAVVVVSSCPAGIIGDDVERACELSTDACPVFAVKADGNMSGDYLQGSLMSYLLVARSFIDKDREPRPRRVNVIAEKMVVTNTQRNFETLNGYLERMGVEVGCRFLYDTTIDELRDFRTAELVLPAYGDYTARLLGRLFEDEFGMDVFERAFPIGFDETCDWLRELGGRFDAAEEVERIIAECSQAYADAVAELSGELAGKRLMVVTYNCELDWILKTALDLGMEIVRIGLLDYSQDQGFRTRLDVDLPVIENYAREDRAEEIADLKPDVLLTNYASAVAGDVPVADTIPMCPDVGFFSGIELARRWARLLKLDLKGGWRDDERLFKRAAE